MHDLFLKVKENKFWYITVTILFFLLWLFSFIALKINDTELMLKFETSGIVIAGVFISLMFILFKDTLLGIQGLLLAPFIFTRYMSVYTVPIILYVMIGVVALALIVHLILYRPKIRLGRFIIGLVTIGVTLVLGGLFVENENKLQDMIFLLAIAVVFIIIYIALVSSTKEDNFRDLAKIMTCLGLMLVLQVVAFIISVGDISLVFSNKIINVGWGVNNNVAIILLFTIPFTAYLSMNTSLYKKILFIGLVYLQVLTIVINYSRGGTFSAFIVCIPLLVIVLLKDKQRKPTFIVNFTYLGLLILGFVLFFVCRPDLFEGLIVNITKINLSNLNGRKEIYIDFINKFNKQPIFGYGMLSLYGDNNVFYQWGHNTMIQTMYALGTVGGLAMLIHLFEKYFYVIRHINLEKWILLFAFVGTDMYGFMDVSYFFINFMIVLIVVLVLSNSLFIKDNQILEINT